MKKCKEIIVSVNANDDNSITNNANNEFIVKALYGTILSFLIQHEIATWYQQEYVVNAFMSKVSIGVLEGTYVWIF